MAPRSLLILLIIVGIFNHAFIGKSIGTSAVSKLPAGAASDVVQIDLKTNQNITNVDSAADIKWIYCVAKPDADPAKLEAGLNWACGEGGADCKAIQLGQPCFFPNNIQNHASFAYNEYWNGKHRKEFGYCDFGGTAYETSIDPSYGACKFTRGWHD